MHRIEDIFSLNLNREMLFFALFLQKCGKSVKGQLTVGGVHQHDHGKVLLHQRLADVQNVDAIIRQDLGHIRNNAFLIFCKYRNNCFQLISSFVFYRKHYKSQCLKSKLD